MSANARRLARYNLPPQAATNNPPAAPVPAANPSVTDYSQQVMRGDFLREGNPHMQGVLDRMRRESNRNLADERSRITGLASGANRFGGDMWQNLQRRAFSEHDLNLQDAQNTALAQMWGDERNRMTQTHATQASYEAQNLATRAREATARAEIAARSGDLRAEIDARLEAQRLQNEAEAELQANQLGFSRQQLAVQGALGAGEQELSGQRILADLINSQMGFDAQMMGLMAGLGRDIGSENLAALGLAPALEGAGYTGLTTAMGAQQGLEAQSAEAARQRAEAERTAWEYERGNREQANRDYLASLLGIASTGSQTHVHGERPPGQYVPPGNPAARGIGDALAGFFGAGGGDWLAGLGRGGGGRIES